MKETLLSKLCLRKKRRKYSHEKSKLSEKRLLSNSLAKEITVILIVKLMVVFLIKWQFFSDPVDLNDINLSVEAKMGVMK